MADKPVASATAVTAPLKSLSMFDSLKQRLIDGGARGKNDGAANGVSAAESRNGSRPTRLAKVQIYSLN
jgi:hypothetical protein